MSNPIITHVRGGGTRRPRLRHVRNPRKRKEILQEQSAIDNDLGSEAHFTLAEATDWVEPRGGTAADIRAGITAGEIYSSEKQGHRYFISPTGLAEWAETQSWWTPI